MARYLARGTMLRRDGVAIAQATTIDGPTMTAEVFSFDDHDIPLGYREKRKTTLDGGQITLTVHFDPDDTGHAVIFDDFDELDDVEDWDIVFPGITAGLSFEAMVIGISPAMPADGALTAQFTLETSGPISLGAIAP